jgi:hypothetical protein
MLSGRRAFILQHTRLQRPPHAPALHLQSTVDRGPPRRRDARRILAQRTILLIKDS